MDVKRQVILAAVIVIMVITLVVYARVTKENNRKKEARWFVENLHYDFCARVLTIKPLPQRWGYGYMVCELEDTHEVSTSVEDSLTSLVRHHEQLNFIVEKTGTTMRFLVQGAQRLSDADADRVCVSSRDDSIVIYKNGNVISSQHMTLCLTNGKFR